MHTLVLRNVPDDLYRQLKDSAAIHRRSMTQEAILSLQAGLEGIDASRGRASPEETLDWLSREVWTLPVLDRRTDEEILGYNPMATSPKPAPQLVIDLAVDTSALTAVLLGDPGVERAKQFLRMQRIRTIPLDEALADAAADADRRFGKGRHPAGLNVGDCFSYALAIRSPAPLLCKGDDFAQTDVQSAAPRAANQT